MNFPGDIEYMFEIIDYLFSRHKISFFISTKDFDILYRWWEKKVPPDIIKSSIDSVKKRRDRKGKPVDSFLNFSYEVKKNLSVRHDLMTNVGIRTEPSSGIKNEEAFLDNFPDDIREFENDFRKLSDKNAGEKRISIERIYDLLMEKFRDDEDLNIKMKLFMGNLPDSMKNDTIAEKFKKNYLKGRFKIPDFDDD